MSIMSVRERSWIGCEQVLSVASWSSQARKWARATGVSSAVAPGPEPGMGSGPRAAVAAVSAVTATTCLDRGNPGR